MEHYNSFGVTERLKLYEDLKMLQISFSNNLIDFNNMVYRANDVGWDSSILYRMQNAAEWNKFGSYIEILKKTISAATLRLTLGVLKPMLEAAQEAPTRRIVAAYVDSWHQSYERGVQNRQNNNGTFTQMQNETNSAIWRFKNMYR